MNRSTANTKLSWREQLIKAGIIKQSVSVPADASTAPAKGSVEPDSNQGITAKTWLYASIETLSPKKKIIVKKKEGVSGANQAIPEPKPELDTGDDADELTRLLLDNPGMTAGSLVNMLKAKGFEIRKKPTIEADSSSANVAAVRNRESSGVVPRGTLAIRAHFREAAASDNGIGPTRFRVVLIQEGLGNFGTAHFYTKEALVSALPVFEGKKIYADHPTLEAEQIHPERSVKDILGHFENLKLEENAEGQAELTGDVVIMADKPYEWARALMRHAVEFAKKFPDKEFVGLSINASGDSREAELSENLSHGCTPILQKLQQAKSMGIERVKIVDKITEAVSCDLVTEAGAGGKVLQMLEQQKNKETEMSTKVKAKGITTKESEIPADDKEKPEVEEAGSNEGEAVEPPAEKHDDVDADKALIKKMLDEYVGKPEGEEDHAEEMYKAAGEAMAAAKEAGMEGEEAIKCAGYTMKMAKHMSAKQAANPESKEAGCDCAKQVEVAQESLKKANADIAKLTGEIAGFKEAKAKIEFQTSVDKMLQESKLPMAVTKKFRETIADVKTKAEVESRLKSFREAYDLGRGGEANNDFSLASQMEKTPTGSEAGETELNFSDCVSN